MPQIIKTIKKAVDCALRRQLRKEPRIPAGKIRNKLLRTQVFDVKSTGLS